MRRLILCSIFSFKIVFYASAWQAYTKIDTVSFDSLNLSFKLLPENRLSEQFITYIDDTVTLPFSSGISIMNTLRGQVPNLTISANAYNAIGNVRLGNTSVILDGIPFNNSLNRLLPLNTFDYKSVTVFSNPNALTAIDGVTDGAIFIESISGIGYSKPMFEVNSYTTYGKFDYEQLDPIWYFSNAVAYSQDFGKVNTRISYTLNASNNEYKYRNPLNHTLNTNTELKITPKFTAQLLTNANIFHQTNDNSGSIMSTMTTLDQNYLNASLQLRYQFADWLYASSRVNVSLEESYRKFEGQNFIEREYNNTRKLANLFLNYDQKFGRFSAKAYTGIQSTTQQYTAALYSDKLQTASYETSVNSPAFSAGTTVIYNDLLSVNGNFRVSEYSSLPNEDNQRNNYSIGLSFLPSSLIKWKPLSVAKIRATYGVRSPWAFWNYPVIPDPQNTLFFGSEMNYAEIGTDVSFLNKRMNLTANYFDNLSKSNMVTNGSGVGGSVIVINGGDLRTTGTEIILSGIPVITSTIKYQASVLWSTCNVEIESDQMGNPNVFLGSQFPDWRASFYNTLTWKNLSMNVLVDANKGGTYFTSIINGPTVADGSFIKLRDLSIGYWFLPAITSTLGLSKLWLSTSFRNPIIYTQDGYDSESTLETQKTISFNIYASF